MKKIHKILYILSMTVILAAIFALLYLGYMLYWPVKTIEFKNNGDLEIVNLNKEVRQGEQLEYKISYCRFTDQQAIVTRVIQDGLIYIMPPIQTNTGIGCQYDKIMSIAEIPKAIPPGKYQMLITVEFKINPLRTITHSLYTEPFTVVK